MTPEQTLKAYLLAANSHDLTGMLEHISDEAIYLFSNESHHIGKNAVKEAIEQNFKTIQNESYSINNLQWLVSSAEFTVCVYEFHWTGEIQGQKVSGSGRGTSVMRLEKDSWKIVHEHLSKGSLGN